MYHRPEFTRAYSAYHQACLDAHRQQGKVAMELPRFDRSVAIDSFAVAELAAASRGSWGPPL